MSSISIIGTAGLPPQYGGFETLAENLVSRASKDISYTVACSRILYKDRKKYYKNARLIYVNILPNGLSSIAYDVVSMFRSLNSDIMLILGVSGSVFLPLIRLFYRGIIITNIDGIEWRRKKWNRLARIYLRGAEKSAIRYSDVIIGDNKAIVDYVKRQYHRNIELIEYGSNCASFKSVDISKMIPYLCKTYAISVCRIEPENNIELILQAFFETPNMPIVIVGNWMMSGYGRGLYRKYANKVAHITLLNPIYDQGIINNLRSKACLYIHGHSAGGTNPSLIEAMYFSLPVIAFDCSFNRETTENSCLFFSTKDELVHHINSSYCNIIKLNTIGKKMADIAERRYSWELIASKYEWLYRSHTIGVE